LKTLANQKGGCARGECESRLRLDRPLFFLRSPARNSASIYEQSWIERGSSGRSDGRERDHGRGLDHQRHLLQAASAFTGDTGWCVQVTFVNQKRLAVMVPAELVNQAQTLVVRVFNEATGCRLPAGAPLPFRPSESPLGLKEGLRGAVRGRASGPIRGSLRLVSAGLAGRER
jgi:hypothetical protein